MPARDHLDNQGRHKPTLARAVPETRHDGAAIAHCRGGHFVVQARPDGTACVAVDSSRLALLEVDEQELRACIAALLSVLGQLDPDHPGRADG